MTIDWEVDYACGPQWETNVTCNDVNIYFDQSVVPCWVHSFTDH